MEEGDDNGDVPGSVGIAGAWRGERASPLWGVGLALGWATCGHACHRGTRWWSKRQGLWVPVLVCLVWSNEHYKVEYPPYSYRAPKPNTTYDFDKHYMR